MEPKKKSKNATIDFDYVRAINEYMDDSFLNKTLQSLKGGSKPNQREIVTYKINNTNYLANLYPDPVSRGGKNTMLLDSIFKVPESFSLDNSMANLDIGGARPKKKPANKGKKQPCDNNNNNKQGKKRMPKKKGGSELYEVDYKEVEDFGGNNDNNNTSSANNEELGGANKKKPGRKPKKNTC